MGKEGHTVYPWGGGGVIQYTHGVIEYTHGKGRGHTVCPLGGITQITHEVIPIATVILVVSSSHDITEMSHGYHMTAL